MKRLFAALLFLICALPSFASDPGDVQLSRRWLNGGQGIEPVFVPEPASTAFWVYDRPNRTLIWKQIGTGFDCSGAFCNVTGGTGPTGATGSPGSNGASAYEIAVANGFIGSQASWLSSLVGATGATGPTGATGSTGAAGVSPIVNRARVTSATDGTYTWTLPTACSTGVLPVVGVTPENGTAGEVINHKLTAVSNTSASIALSRAVLTLNGLLGLTIPIIQTSPGAQVIHMTAICP